MMAGKLFCVPARERDGVETTIIARPKIPQRVTARLYSRVELTIHISATKIVEIGPKYPHQAQSLLSYSFANSYINY